MNHSAGFALIKYTWTSWMQYRSFFFVLAFGWMIPPLTSLFIWSTAAGEATVGGMNRGEFVAYYLILILVNQITYAQTNWTVGDNIREGNLNAWLLRPIWPLYHVISSEIAGKVVFMVFVIPAAAILSLALHPEFHAGLAQVAVFVPALAFAWMLRFFWGLALALLAFWSTRADALLAVQDALVFLFSGILAPIVLLPGATQTAARLLPFYYMVGFPVDVMTAPWNAARIAAGFGLQVGWLALAMLAAWLTWRAGLRRYAAIGG